MKCEIEECLLGDDFVPAHPGICATCSRCGHQATGSSVGHALAILRDECPHDEDNFYVAEEEGAESPMPDPVVKPWWQK